MTVVDLGLAAALVAVLGFVFAQSVRGTHTLDLSRGRTVHPFRPIEVASDAPR